jgi:hypothetical protein
MTSLDAPNHRRQSKVCCPTCRATQEWSEVCRRCKCDLQLLEAVAVAYTRARRRCLEALSDGRLVEAQELARYCHWLEPGPESRRLLSLCALLGGDWPTALALARGLPA